MRAVYIHAYIYKCVAHKISIQINWTFIGVMAIESPVIGLGPIIGLGYVMRSIFLNGDYVSEDEAQISIFDRSVQFADSIYEVLSVIDGKIVDFAGHINRLSRSLAELNIVNTPSDSEWLAIFRKLIALNNLSEGIIYLQITRGVAERDFQYSDALTPTLIAYTQEKQLIDNPKLADGLSVMLAQDLRWGRCDIKTTQLLYASMIKSEAKAKGYDDAWLMRDNLITEGTSNNAAIITQDDILVTHKLSPAILAGTTRNIILDIANDSSLKIEERAFTLEEAIAAKEAFISAASLFIMPVTRVDDKIIGSGEVGAHTLSLRQKYIDWAREISL